MLATWAGSRRTKELSRSPGDPVSLKSAPRVMRVILGYAARLPVLAKGGAGPLSLSNYRHLLRRAIGYGPAIASLSDLDHGAQRNPDHISQAHGGETPLCHHGVSGRA